MKVRSGFVSNSSSASYVIKINMELNNFVETIFEEFQYCYFSVDNIISYVEEQIHEYENCLKEKDNNSLSALTFHFYNQQDLQKLKNEINTLIKLKPLNGYHQSEEGEFEIDKVNSIKWILETQYNVDLKSISSDYIQLKGRTSMHNSYDDVPEILRSIITFFNFEMPEVKIFYKKESD